MKSLIKNIFVSLAILSGAGIAAAGNLTLSWVANPDTNVVGYKIYYGTASQAYTANVVAGNVTNLIVGGLTAGTTYYFAATSYDAAGNESSFSTETSGIIVNTNAAPTLDSIANVSVNENSGSLVVNLTGISTGNTNVIAPLSVTATSDNPSLVPAPVVSYTSPGSTGTLTVTPAANACGTANLTVTVSVNNNTVSRTFVVTVNPPALPPTLSPLNPVTINENSGVDTLALNGITSGSPNQTQLITVSVSVDNPALIPFPSVSYTSPNTTGYLNFAPAANAYGTAIITITVNNGGTVNNTVSQSFTVTVTATPTNHPPTLNPLPNLTINENTNQQNVLLSGITAGTIKTNATLKVTASSSNTKLVQPSVTYTSPATTGTLTFKPGHNSYGSAVITVTVNNGAASNNVVTRTFTVTVLSPAQAATSKAAEPTSTPAVLTPVSGGVNGQFSFTVSGTDGAQYVVQATTDLANWTSLQTNTAPFTFVDTAAGNYGKRFYRATSAQ